MPRFDVVLNELDASIAELEVIAIEGGALADGMRLASLVARRTILHAAEQGLPLTGSPGTLMAMVRQAVEDSRARVVANRETASGA